MPYKISLGDSFAIELPGLQQIHGKDPFTPEQRVQRKAEKLLAEKASAASAVSLLALSHIYTASSKGGDVAPTADEPVTKQQASTGG